MMTQYQFLDELVREYLLFRGFVTTLKSFDTDLKNEKEKGFRVEKIVDHIQQSISSHDIQSLLELWKHFESKLFSRLDTPRLAAVRKLENSLYKLYAVCCVQSKQHEKLREFFEKMTHDLHGQTEWKDWFALPYIKDPADSPAFSLYFSRQWQDTLIMSLTNFLSIIFQSLPPPRLADYKKTTLRFNKMREEIKHMKLRLAAADMDLDPNLCQGNLKNLVQPPSKENMEDFFTIAHETAVVDNQVKSFRSFLQTITGGSGDRKKSPVSKSRSSSKSRSAVVGSSTSSSSTISSSYVPVSKQLKKVSQSSIKSDHLPVVICSNNSVSGANVKPTTSSETLESMHAKSKEEKTEIEPASTSHSSREKEKTSTSSKYLLLGEDCYSEHRSEVTLLSISSIGAKIVSVDKSGVIKVWTLAPTPTTLATFISGSGVSAVTWVEASDQYFLYGTVSGQVRLCDVQDKMSVAEVSQDLLSGNSVTVLQSGPSSSTFLLCAGVKMLLLDTANCRLDRDLSHESLTPVTCATFNHNGNVLIHASIDGKVGMTDLNRGELLCVWSVHSSPVTCIVLNNDQTGVWSVSADYVMAFSNIVKTNDKVWEATLPGYSELITNTKVTPAICISSDGDHILTNSYGEANICKLPNVSGTEKEKHDLEMTLSLTRGDTCQVSSVLWSSGDCVPALCGLKDGSVKIFTLLSQ